jgi:hypothetical protein
MLKRIYIIITGGILLTCNAFAEDNNLKYSLAFVGMSMDYKEYDQSNTLADSENSSLGKIAGYDMSLGYLFNRTDSSSSVDEAAFNVSMLNGKSDYVGQSLNNPQGYGSVVSTTQNRFIDTSLDYKHTQRYQNFLDFSYGLGVGYHSWYRELSSIQSELYEWYSLRPMVGVTMVMDKFSLGVTGEYQYGYNAVMSATNPSINFKLGGADILAVSFPLRYNYNKNLEFFTQYTMTKQSIKKSNEVQSGGLYYYEPDSTSYQNYLKIGATFKF